MRGGTRSAASHSSSELPFRNRQAKREDHQRGGEAGADQPHERGSGRPRQPRAKAQYRVGQQRSGGAAKTGHRGQCAARTIIDDSTMRPCRNCRQQRCQPAQRPIPCRAATPDSAPDKHRQAGQGSRANRSFATADPPRQRPVGPTRLWVSRVDEVFSARVVRIVRNERDQQRDADAGQREADQLGQMLSDRAERPERAAWSERSGWSVPPGRGHGSDVTFILAR